MSTMYLARYDPRVVEAVQARVWFTRDPEQAHNYLDSYSVFDVPVLWPGPCN